MDTEVLSALITAGFLFLGTAVTVLAKSNRREHNENSGKLDRVLEATEFLKSGHGRIESKIDGHIASHAKGDYDQ